ncbi:hypothetical protein PVAND_015854 [Polypedilum vanderplanki]|uniref:Peptidase S1 domain-containing protein n=1 Tax=Polypedilum vanderplanki TaxID=319348 RepID=A0A9J6BE58_POLVA|nr:hypothetical protein PVAND_015854 [Polypedilum vanderplanki]
MKIFLIFVSILTEIANGKTNWTRINDVCGVSHGDRIIGGTKAALGQYPWVAHIGLLKQERNDHKLSYECGGSLIHPKFVISAAHCVYGLGNNERVATIKLGEHNLETDIDCEGNHCADPPQVFYPERIYVPREYNDTKLKHDIALIELDEPANFTRYVLPVCLPSGDMIKNDLMSMMVEITGWGYFDIDDPVSSSILNVVRLPVVEIEKCKEIKQLSVYEFSKGQMCVGGIKGKDSCNGDSGGPLVKAMSMDNYGPRYILFGLVSVGVPSCGKFSLPAVYTNVSHYLPWIYDVIN